MSTRRRRQLQIDVDDDLLPSSGRRSCADWDDSLVGKDMFWCVLQRNGQSQGFCGVDWCVLSLLGVT